MVSRGPGAWTRSLIATLTTSACNRSADVRTFTHHSGTGRNGGLRMWDLRHLLSAVVLPLALATFLASALASAAPHTSAAEPDGTCGLCVLAPSGTSLTSTGNGALVVNGANVVVNSRGAPAVKVTSNASVSARSVGVVGSV